MKVRLFESNELLFEIESAQMFNQNFTIISISKFWFDWSKKDFMISVRQIAFVFETDF